MLQTFLFPLLTNTLPGLSTFEVVTLWRYYNLFITIISFRRFVTNTHRQREDIFCIAIQFSTFARRTVTGTSCCNGRRRRCWRRRRMQLVGLQRRRVLLLDLSIASRARTYPHLDHISAKHLSRAVLQREDDLKWPPVEAAGARRETGELIQVRRQHT